VQDREAALRTAPAKFTPLPLSGDRLVVLLQAKLAKVESIPGVDGSGSMVINDTAKAWAIDPWLWTAGDPESLEEQKRILGDGAPLAVYVCKDYQVSVFTTVDPGGGWPLMWHLSIKRRDREPIDENRWRILQHIKNTLVGPENEAVELYPAESRLVDTANQYHLFVFRNPEQQWPFGFTERFVTSTQSHGSKQRPLPSGTAETPPEVFVQGMTDIYGADEDDG